MRETNKETANHAAVPHGGKKVTNTHGQKWLVGV